MMIFIGTLFCNLQRRFVSHGHLNLHRTRLRHSVDMEVTTIDLTSDKPAGADLPEEMLPQLLTQDVIDTPSERPPPPPACFGSLTVP